MAGQHPKPQQDPADWTVEDHLEHVQQRNAQRSAFGHEPPPAEHRFTLTRTTVVPNVASDMIATLNDPVLLAAIDKHRVFGSHTRISRPRPRGAGRPARRRTGSTSRASSSSDPDEPASEPPAPAGPPTGGRP